MQTKEIKISELVPNGYEIDKEKSTIENIILKPINELPLSYFEIPNLNYSIFDPHRRLNLSTENRVKAFIALIQLIELRDAWNGDWVVDWSNSKDKYSIILYENKEIRVENAFGYKRVLCFKTRELAEKFAAQFEDLINEAKELL